MECSLLIYNLICKIAKIREQDREQKRISINTKTRLYCTNKNTVIHKEKLYVHNVSHLIYIIYANLWQTLQFVTT